MHRRTLAASLLLALAALSCRAEDEEARLRYGRHLAGECTSCHRDGGVDGAIPSLAGRPAEEILALLEDFRQGRKSNPVMVSVARSLDAAQSSALAAYLSALPRSADAAAPR
jgi:cytochrome c553